MIPVGRNHIELELKEEKERGWKRPGKVEKGRERQVCFGEDLPPQPVHLGMYDQITL